MAKSSPGSGLWGGWGQTIKDIGGHGHEPWEAGGDTISIHNL